MPTIPTPAFGAILAGGRSSRFRGGPKALARLGAETIVARIVSVLERASIEPHLITNTPQEFFELGIPMRGDSMPGHGPLSGILAALAWARESGRSFALCVACDLPFVQPDLLRELSARAESGEFDVVLPESRGPLGHEPLCAAYSVAAVDRLVESLHEGTVSLGEVVNGLGVHRVPLPVVERFGVTTTLFHNVNTRAELERAAGLLNDMERRGSGGSG